MPSTTRLETLLHPTRLTLLALALAACGSGEPSCAELTDSACTVRHDANGQPITTPTAECAAPLQHGESVPHSHPVQYSITLPSGEIGAFTARYTVPPDPVFGCDNQTLYYYIGIQEAEANTSVVQPLLGWWKDEGGWFLMSEECCNPYYRKSAPVRVKAGDVIEASIVRQGTSYVITTSAGSGSTVLVADASFGVFNQAVASFEVWNLGTCGELPTTEFVFEILSLTDIEGRAIPQNWLLDPLTDVCAANVTVTSATVSP